MRRRGDRRPGPADLFFPFGQTDGDRATAIFPAMSQPVGDRFTLAGKLTGDEATVTLRYGYQGQKPQTRTFRVTGRRPSRARSCGVSGRRRNWPS